MLKSRRWLIALTVVSIVLAGAIWGSWSIPPTHTPPIEGQQRTEAANQTSAEREIGETLWQRTTTDPVALFTFWVALFTCAMAVSTIGLWIVTYLSLRHARQTAEKQLRAYVLVSQVRSIDIFEAPHHFIEIKNHGQTPAHDVVMRYIIRVDVFPLKHAPDIRSQGNFSRALLGPGEKLHDEFSPDKRIAVDAQRQIRDGTAALYILGAIYYRDAFGIKRTTKFRFMAGGNIGIHPQGGMSACEEGNEAD